MAIRKFLFLLLFFCAVMLPAQQAEYTFYRWSNQPSAFSAANVKDTTRPHCFFSHSQTELVASMQEGSARPEWHTLLHQKIYFPGWQSIRALRAMEIPGVVINMQARLYDAAAAMVDTQTANLLVYDESMNGSVQFTGRMPGAVLEFIILSSVPFQGFFEQAWNHPVEGSNTVQLILPENFIYRHKAYYTQTGFERSLRDGKLFLTSRLPAMSADVFAESGAYGTYTPRLRYVVFPPGTDTKDLWGRMYAILQQRMDELPITIPGQKKPLNPARIMRQAGVNKKTTVAYIPGIFLRHLASDKKTADLSSTQRSALLHRMLAEAGIPHRFYFANPAPNLPFDTSFLWFPDMNELLIYLPVSGEWIPKMLYGIARNPPDMYIGRMAFVMEGSMPGKPSSGYRFETVPHPCDWVNEELSELYWNGDSVMRFMRHYKGFPAREFAEYATLEPELRANLDIAIARTFAPDAWLLEAKAKSLGTPVPEHMIFNGRFSSRSLVEYHDSVMYLHVGRFLGFADTIDHPQWRSTPIDVLGRFNRVKYLHIQIPQGWELADMPLRDTAFQYTAKSSSCPLQPDLMFNLKIERSGKDKIRIYRGDSYLFPSYSGEGAVRFWQQSKMGNELLPIALKFRKKQ